MQRLPTEFMLDASREKAEQVLLDQTHFNVNAKRYKAFVAPMDAPLSKNAALKRLLASAHLGSSDAAGHSPVEPLTLLLGLHETG